MATVLSKFLSCPCLAECSPSALCLQLPSSHRPAPNPARHTSAALSLLRPGASALRCPHSLAVLRTAPCGLFPGVREGGSCTGLLLSSSPFSRGSCFLPPCASLLDQQGGTTLPNVTSLPTIDLSPFAAVSLEQVEAQAASNPQAQECIQHLHLACCHTGFFYLVNHGVPQVLCDQVRDVVRAFFLLPPEEKNKIALHNSPLLRGYQRVGQNITKGRSDWHEAIDLYREFPPDHPAVLAGKPLHGPNQWPLKPEELKPTLEQYVVALTGLGRLVMRLIALALSLPADCFEHDRAGDTFWVLRAIGYPPLPLSASTQGSLSCGEHTDYGLLTFVNQDPHVTALQVKSRQGTWLDAPPVPGAFVVNIGDMLTVWTNGLYQSTLHRVLNGSPDFRVSVPFFYEPNFDARVAPLPECVARSEGKVPVYGEVVYGEHLQQKVYTNFN